MNNREIDYILRLARMVKASADEPDNNDVSRLMMDSFVGGSFEAGVVSALYYAMKTHLLDSSVGEHHAYRIKVDNGEPQENIEFRLAHPVFLESKQFYKVTRDGDVKMNYGIVCVDSQFQLIDTVSFHFALYCEGDDNFILHISDKDTRHYRSVLCNKAAVFVMRHVGYNYDLTRDNFTPATPEEVLQALHFLEAAGYTWYHEEVRKIDRDE